MKEKQKFALQGFFNGNNCAQSVITAYANEFDMDTGQLLRVASSFVGGMGKLQQTCGAVTGAYMLIGLRNSVLFDKDEEQKKATIMMVQEFQKRFVRLNGSDQCSNLITVDLKNKEGKEQFDREQMKENICSKCIASSIEILEGLFSN
ncbi:C-GCAxxG-C-C family protein [Carboxylicivirga linearis]|uniref:C_GCAxxG_C_C family protein n=1 Tax=Carboxylicivirga linearis TaxID=1628157 RepID=A0ABS5JPH7_9BACT|nr:C-GCAxxG-C-C family protein [Carboxylicivirga linearis]MBS2096799.1 C_GCAxxG_C_C family protein [Carboxylicivirga linearis]